MIMSRKKVYHRQKDFLKFYALFFNTVQKQIFVLGLASFGAFFLFAIIALPPPFQARLVMTTANNQLGTVTTGNYEPTRQLPSLQQIKAQKVNNEWGWDWDIGMVRAIRSFFGFASEETESRNRWRCSRGDRVTLMLDIKRKILMKIRK